MLDTAVPDILNDKPSLSLTNCKLTVKAEASKIIGRIIENVKFI
jgi:hypothetical protein